MMNRAFGNTLSTFWYQYRYWTTGNETNKLVWIAR